MEAKDTVLGYKIVKGDDAVQFPTLGEQAEVSFKAGIKEVVKLLKLYNPVVGSDERTNCYMLDVPFWQNKLKEWGLE